MSNEILIRVDGSPQIGLGHVVRCIALANMLKEDFRIHFISKEIPKSIIDDITSSGFKFTKIETEESFFKLLTSEKIVVLDNYFFETAFQQKIKETGCKLVCIDDLHDKEFYADLIINHAPNVTPNDYQCQPYTKFALGLDYVLLRPSFLKAAKMQRDIKKTETAFVCFGGSDIKNITTIAVNILVKRKEFKKIIVVLGASFQNIDSFKSLSYNTDWMEVYHSVDDDLMLELLERSDVAFVPASGVLLEAISAGCIVVSGMYADNQKINYEYYRDSNIIVDAQQFNEDSLERAIQICLDKKNIPLKLIDGLSEKRIKRLFFSIGVHLRSAVQEDDRLLFGWVNDPAVRISAFNTDSVSWDNHVNWFRSKLNSSDTQIFILERNSITIGQIRFEMEEDYWKVDYSIDKKFRGYGLGTTIIQLGLEKIKGKIKAWVKEDNIPSNRVFQNLGFRKENEANSTVEYSINNGIS